MLQQYNDSPQESSLGEHSVDGLRSDKLKEAALTAMAELRAHGTAGIKRNLTAAASLAALKDRLRPLRGEFGRFCAEELKISPSYRARLLRLHKDREHLPKALAWAESLNHPLAECQSAQNLIKVVDDWRARDKPAKPKPDSRADGSNQSKEIMAGQERRIEEVAALVKNRDKTIEDQRFEIATRDSAIADLKRRLAECEADIVALRDDLPEEARRQASAALSSNQEAALSRIAKRYHWRMQDLRKDLESCTAV